MSREKLWEIEIALLYLRIGKLRANEATLPLWRAIKKIVKDYNINVNAYKGKENEPLRSI